MKLTNDQRRYLLGMGYSPLDVQGMKDGTWFFDLGYDKDDDDYEDDEETSLDRMNEIYTSGIPGLNPLDFLR